MSFAAIDFFQQYSIEYLTEGHKHCRPGWVQIKCPFCIGNPGWHLGFEMSSDWWSCWRCGYKRTWDVVLALVNNDVREAKKVLAVYKGRPVARKRKLIREDRFLELPNGLQSLSKRARQYLSRRKFDPDLLEHFWKLQSTSNFGELKYRIFIPFFFEERMVSWQCRDITDRSGVKYLAQIEAKEIINNKDMVYGIDQVPGKSCVVVEGVPDTWRLGPGSVALCGIEFRSSQVHMLLSRFDEFHILFDPEPQAIIQAEKLAFDLSCYGKACKVWYLEEGGGDPGEMAQDDADHFMREALGYTGY